MKHRQILFRIQKKEPGGGGARSINPKLNQMKKKISKTTKNRVFSPNSLVLGTPHTKQALKALQDKQIDRKDYDHLQSGIIRSP